MFAPCLSVVLEWHSATAEHRSHLTSFRCTYPPYPRIDEETGEEFHDYPWELEVQRHINRLRPPLSPPGFLLLGFDEGALAALLEVIVTPLDRFCFIPTLAVAHDRSRNGLAGEALDLVERVMQKYDFADDFVVQARIDPDNHSAKSVFAGRKYAKLEFLNGYETWGRLY